MKKGLLRILSCIMICAILCATFAACGEEDIISGKYSGDDDTNGSDSVADSNEEESGSDESDEEISAELDSKSFNIFFDKEYVCAIVSPKNATDAEKDVVNVLKNGFKEKTGKNALAVIEGDERIEECVTLILVGNTSYDESKSAYKGLADRSAKIKITKDKMAIAFNNRSSGIKMAEKLVDAIEKCNKKEVKVKRTFSASYTSLPEKQEFVEYTGGNSQKKVESENGTVLYTSFGNTLSDFNSYCDQLSSIGFEIDQELSAASNLFKTFKGEDVYAQVYYVNKSLTKRYELGATKCTPITDNVSGVVKVALGPIENFAQSDMTGGSGSSTATKLGIVSVPVGGLEDVGQGYIFVLPDGRLIVQDSGLVSPSNDDFMYNNIKSIAPDPDNVVIAAWFISHPHGDHQGGLMEFTEKHGSDKDITIERIIYNYSKAELYDVVRYDCPYEDGKPPMEYSAHSVTDFYENVEEYIPDVPLLMAHTGQVFNFGNGVTVEVLFTVEDIVPDEMENPNNSSMVIRVNIGGQKVLLLGDTAHKSNPMIVEMWDSYLKADIVQIAHHGIWTPDDGIYELIGAKVYLWPANYAVAKASFAHSGYKAVIEKIYNLASDLYVSDSSAPVKVLDLPYVIQNNKAAEKNRIDSAK